MINKIVLSIFTVLVFTSQSIAAPASIPLPAADSGSILMGSTTSDYTGQVITNLGDLDGDKYSNIAIGASRYNSVSNKGAVYIIDGNAVPLNKNINLLDNSETIITGEVLNSFYGSCIGENVLSLGDINSNGLPEVVISGRCSGSLYILFGQRPMPKNIKASDIATTIPGVVITNIPNGSNKYSMATADVNGDKIKDIIISYLDDGTTTVINGALLPKTNSIVTFQSLLLPTKSVTFVVPNNPYLMNRISVLDVDRDGKSDILMANLSNKSVYGVLGKAINFSTLPVAVNLTSTFLNGVNGFVIDTGEDLRADSVFAVGDLVGRDNYLDFIIRGQQLGGKYRAALVSGRKTWLASYAISSMVTAKSAFYIDGLGSYDLDSPNMTQVDDMDADGYKDSMIGDYSYSSGKGRAVVLFSRETFTSPISLSSTNGVSASSFISSQAENAGAAVGYAENLYGGIGCGTDTAYFIGSPTYNGQGKVHVYNIKK